MRVYLCKVGDRWIFINRKSSELFFRGTRRASQTWIITAVPLSCNRCLVIIKAWALTHQIMCPEISRNTHAQISINSVIYMSFGNDEKVPKSKRIEPKTKRPRKKSFHASAFPFLIIFSFLSSHFIFLIALYSCRGHIDCILSHL